MFDNVFGLERKRPSQIHEQVGVNVLRNRVDDGHDIFKLCFQEFALKCLLGWEGGTQMKTLGEG